MGAPSGMPGDSPMFTAGGAGKRRGAANRYVDALGGGGPVPASKPTASFLPTPGLLPAGPANVLKPMMPMVPQAGEGQAGGYSWDSFGATGGDEGGQEAPVQPAEGQ